jgi:hypothetical protein
MRRFLAIPCLVILPILLAGCGAEEQQVSCGDFEKRMVEFEKTVVSDAWKAGSAKVSGDAKSVCQTSSSILSNARPLFKAASSCKSISSAVGLNRLIRKMEELRQETRCA